MTREEIVNKAVYVQYPFNNEVYRDLYKEYKPVRFPIISSSTPLKKVMYINMGDNGHHYTLYYHFTYVWPRLEKLLGFKFDMSLYEWKKQDTSTGDMSRWVPIKSPKFEVTDFISKKHGIMSFDDLQPLNSNKDKYRYLYRYPHSCSKIVNLNMPENGEKLMVVGDSQSIPDIPYLAMHFREVWYFDNRTGWKVDPRYGVDPNVTNKFIPVYEDTVSYADKYKNVNFDKVLIQFYCSHPSRYLKTNLK